MVLNQVPLSEVLKLDIEAVEINPSESYDMAGVYSFGRGIFNRKALRGSETTYKRFHRLKEGSIVLSQLKGWEGAIAIVDGASAGRHLSTQFPTFSCNERRAEIDFLRWFFRYSQVWDRLRSKARGMGARRDTISPNEFLSLTIPLPSLDEQRRIAAQLNKVAELVEERRQKVATTETEMQALLSKAFARAITGAPRRPMAEVAPLVRRAVQVKPDQEYTEIGVRSFYNGIFHRRTMLGSEFSWQDLFWIKAGDLVFSNLMAWERAIAVAGTIDAGTVGNHRMLTCAVDPALATPNFLMAYFRTPEGFASVVGHSPGTIARNKTLSSKKLPTIDVPIPSLEIQQWFDDLEAKARKVRAIRSQTATDIDTLIPAMLDIIFNGSAGQ